MHGCIHIATWDRAVSKQSVWLRTQQPEFVSVQRFGFYFLVPSASKHYPASCSFLHQLYRWGEHETTSSVPFDTYSYSAYTNTEGNLQDVLQTCVFMYAYVYMDVCVYICMCVCCDGLITGPEESYRMSVRVCEQETPKREAKGPSLTISACEWMNEYVYMYVCMHARAYVCVCMSVGIYMWMYVGMHRAEINQEVNLVFWIIYSNDRQWRRSIKFLRNVRKILQFDTVLYQDKAAVEQSTLRIDRTCFILHRHGSIEQSSLRNQ
jgi:hypothetical protein